MCESDLRGAANLELSRLILCFAVSQESADQITSEARKLGKPTKTVMSQVTTPLVEIEIGDHLILVKYIFVKITLNFPRGTGQANTLQISSYCIPRRDRKVKSD